MKYTKAQLTEGLMATIEHQRMVELIVKALANIDYHLNKLQDINKEKPSPSLREAFEKSYKAHLNDDFQFLEHEDHMNYIHGFSSLCRAYNELKLRYEAEVIANSEILN